MKIIFLILLVLLLVYLFVVYIQTRHLIAISDDLASNAEVFSREYDTKNDAEKSFLVIGDSTAVGTGALRKEESIAGRLGFDYPRASIINLGVNGSKTNELIPRLTSLGDKQYDFILIQIGGNDIVRRTKLVELKQSIDAVLSEAKKHSDNVMLMTSGNVGIAKLLPFGTRFIFTKRTRAVREIFIEISEKNQVLYVDIFRESKDDPFAQNPEKYFSEDFFHPSSEGYADWYTFVRTQLDTLSL